MNAKKQKTSRKVSELLSDSFLQEQYADNVLIKAFITPFTDIGKVLQHGIKKTTTKGFGQLGIALSNVAAILLPFKSFTDIINKQKEKLAQETMKLYKENNVNPLAGCLPLLIQLPILIALYQVFIKGITPESLTLLYSFISSPEVVHHNFLGLFDVTTRSRLLTLVAGGFQFIQSKQSTALQADGSNSPAGGKEMAALSKQMLYFFPVMIIIIGWNLPAGLILYWIATTVFSVFEQSYIKRKK